MYSKKESKRAGIGSFELKATDGDTGASEETQLKNYLKLLKIKQGILINFQQPGKKDDKIHLEIKELHIELPRMWYNND